MRTLSLGVFAEGPTDIDFFSPLLVRLATGLIERGHHQAQVADPMSLPGRPSTDTFCNLIAKYATSIDLLVVHADANSSFDRAMNERIQPWFAMVEDSPERPRGLRLVPAVPVRETEAWMLADVKALNVVLGTCKTNRDFDLPTRAREVEQITEPKQKLGEVQKVARGKRQARRVGLRPLYARLGQEVSLDRLRLIPAFRNFATDFELALVQLGFLPRTS